MRSIYPDEVGSIDSDEQGSLCPIIPVYDHTSDKLVEFLIENGKTESHFKQANLWNSRELKKEVNFNRAKHQVQIAVKLSDMNQAKIWAKVVIEQASKEGVKLAAEDQWIIDLSKDKRIKNSG